MISSAAVAAKTLSPEDMQLLFGNIHSTWLLDSLYLFVLSPLSAVGCVLNLLSAVTLSKIIRNSKTLTDKTNIYKYLRIYSLNNALVSLILTLSFIGFSPHYFQFALDRAARFYRCVVINASTTFYFYKNVLDVLIALERLSLLVPWLRRFKAKSPHLACLIAFLVCALVNSPTYYFAQTKSDADFFNVTLVTDAYCHLPAFCATLEGKTITFVVFVCRDLVPIVGEVAFSVLAVQQLRRWRNVLNSDDARIIESERQLIVITAYILIVSVSSHSIVFLVYLSLSLGFQAVFAGWLSFLAMLSTSASFFLNFFIIFRHSRVFRECLTDIMRQIRFESSF